MEDNNNKPWQFKKGNRFWEKRTKHGRDKIFTDPQVLWEAACEYFKWVEDNPLWEDKPVHYQGVMIDNCVAKMRAMSIEGLCFYLGIGHRTWYDYKERDCNKEDDLDGFSRVMEDIEHIIKQQKFSGAAADLLNANIIARDLGLKDKSESEIKAYIEEKPLEQRSLEELEKMLEETRRKQKKS